MSDNWTNALLYESYVGRWSRKVAVEFTEWLGQKENLTWLDVGCGTGALSEAIINKYNPKFIIGIDPSEEHLKAYKNYFGNDRRVDFRNADAEKTGLDESSVDVVVSGLVLNFVPDIIKAIYEFKRVLTDNGTIGIYIWDYAGKMELMRYFWDAAASLFEDAKFKDEAYRFPYCNIDAMMNLFKNAGLSEIEAINIDVPTVFKNFNDYWDPFLTNIAPAPGYCMSLSEKDRNKLKEKIFTSLPFQNDGSIHIVARAIAIKSKK